MEKKRFEDLVSLMARLRAPDGCPWDRAQTPQSLRTYLLEETYEALDAIERNDPRALKDELGDLLLQVLFHAQMAAEQGRFSIDDVLTELHDKLVRRPPHVFGTAKADSPEQVVVNWEALKAAERNAHADGPALRAKPEGKSVLAGGPRAAPAPHQGAHVPRAARPGGGRAQGTRASPKGTPSGNGASRKASRCFRSKISSKPGRSSATASA